MMVLSKSIPIRISSANPLLVCRDALKTAFGFTDDRSKSAATLSSSAGGSVPFPCVPPRTLVLTLSLRTGTHHEQILGHRIEAGMHHLVVHRKKEHSGEILLEQNLKF